MRDARIWLIELEAVAPRVDRTLLRVLAELLAANVSVDVLLVLNDRLREAAMHARIDGRLRDAIEIAAVGGALEREAARPRPGFW